MIPVQGYTGARVGVLGLGRSGLSAARALKEGGGVPVCWDDNDAARAKAEAEGFEMAKLTGATLKDLAVVSERLDEVQEAVQRCIMRADALERRLPAEVGGSL